MSPPDLSGTWFNERVQMVTPGDWTHGPVNIHHSDDVAIFADGEMIAKVVGIGNNSERDANVRAIVNASKMLEMLKHVLSLSLIHI